MDVYIENIKQHFSCPTPSALELLSLVQPKLDAVPCTLAINGTVCDWSTPLKHQDRVCFFSFEHKKGKEVFWHSSAHVLAQAILRLYPQAKPTIGPPIEQGFYYDFADLSFSEKDFSLVEAEIQKICASNYAIERHEFVDQAQAEQKFDQNKFKKDLIAEFRTDLSYYTQGEFYDLCRGPHLRATGQIKAVKLLKTAGAYWRGNSDNEQLTRVYAISFPTQAELDHYLHILEESKKRDHRLIGQKLNLFSFQSDAPGMPFIHPKGSVVWLELIEYWRKLHQEHDYQEIKTPTMLKKNLWETSGHWQNYRENMYLSHVDDEDYAIKPMNCPGACIFYSSQKRSYRDLPLRVSEIGHVHRHEMSGALSGLFRVRSFHQDDAHLYLTLANLKPEIAKVLALCERIYSTFGLNYHFELSTKPENAIGTAEIWEASTLALQQVLEESNRSYQLNEGDGAFYGPKIDMHVQDALGRFWQCGTIQLDMNLPQKFDLRYTTANDAEEQPIMVHNAIYGSIERFMGILIEHFSGRFPLWLSPEQVRLLTINEQQLSYAQELAQHLTAANIRTRVDHSHESLNKKIRTAQQDQVNYILVLGNKEMESKTISVRPREGGNFAAVDFNRFLEKISQEIAERSLHKLFPGV